MDLLDEKSKVPAIPLGEGVWGGGMVTNDWLIGLIVITCILFLLFDVGLSCL